LDRLISVKIPALWQDARKLIRRRLEEIDVGRRLGGKFTLAFTR
jgi:hypothetical protein